MNEHHIRSSLKCWVSLVVDYHPLSSIVSLVVFLKWVLTLPWDSTSEFVVSFVKVSGFSVTKLNNDKQQKKGFDGEKIAFCDVRVYILLAQVL